MYQRELSHLPIEITREEFVELAFELGRCYNHGLDTTVAVVQLGDYFVNFQGERNSFKCDNFLEPISQIYSVELAHIITVIIAKFNEDFGYRSTKEAIIETGNRYLIKMEYEILRLINFHVVINNFITLIWNLILSVDNNHKLSLSSAFWYFSKEVCINKELLSKDHRLIVLAVIILHKKGQLKAVKDNRHRIFEEIIIQTSIEYEIESVDILRAYNQMKKGVL